MLRPTRILLWRLTAWVTLVIGLAALLVPVIPTVPLLIIAAWAGGKGWPSLEQRLLAHATFGPQIRAWRERRAVSRRAKVLSTLGMCASGVGLQFSMLPEAMRFGVPALMFLVALWLWRRPEI